MTEHKIHKYLRIKSKNTVIHRCVLTGCNHYITKDFIVGKECICWRCPDDKKTFVISGNMKYKTRPYCELHNKKKEEIDKNIPVNVVDELLKKVL